MTASPDPHVGLPSEEEIARALAEALRQKRIPDEIWSQMVASFRKLEGKFPDYAEGFSGSTDAFRGARAILSLLRPAFEAKDQRIRELVMLLDKQMGTPCEQIRHQQEVEALREQAHYANGVAELAMKHRDEAEAKLAQAVEALQPFAWPPLYVFDKDQAFVPTTKPDDWEGGGYFTTEDFRRARVAAAFGGKK